MDGEDRGQLAPATKILFITAMVELSEATWADVMQLADAIGFDDRIGRKFLNAGLGGGCLTKDIWAHGAHRRTGCRSGGHLPPRAFGEVVASKRVLDGRNALDREAWIAAGWTYPALGRWHG